MKTFEILNIILMNPKVFDILYAIMEKGYNTRYSWSKNYDNGTALLEYKIFKSNRHKTPIAFVQIGFHLDTNKVIGFTFSYMPKPNEIVDCMTMEDLYKCLNKLKEFIL